MINDLTFGIEIECILSVDRDTLVQKLQDVGVSANIETYNHNISFSNWKITTDGSICDLNGIELVSPILKGEEGLKTVRKVYKVLKDLNTKVDKNCGFHVHVGVKDETLDFFKNLYKIYAGFEGVIDGFMPPSRRLNNNRYCKSISFMKDKISSIDNIREIERLISHTVPGESRYVKLNINSFWRQGTIEFRHHSGTVNSSKALSWIMVCLRMVERAKKELSQGMQDVVSETIVYVNPPMPSFSRSYSREAAIIRMLFREEGVTSEEVHAEYGVNVSIGNLAKKHNISVRSVHLGNHVKRFYVEKVPVTTRIISNLGNFEYNFDNFIQELELNSLEASFFQDRTEELANA